VEPVGGHIGAAESGFELLGVFLLDGWFGDDEVEWYGGVFVDDGEGFVVGVCVGPAVGAGSEVVGGDVEFFALVEDDGFEVFEFVGDVGGDVEFMGVLLSSLAGLFEVGSGLVDGVLEGFGVDEGAEFALVGVCEHGEVFEFGGYHVDVAFFFPEALEGTLGVLDHDVGPVGVPGVVGWGEAIEDLSCVGGAGGDVVAAGVDLVVEDEDVVVAMVR